MNETKDDYKKLIFATNELVNSQFVELFGGIKETVKLGSICKTNSGGTPSRHRPEYFDGGIPWITTVALGKTYLHEQDGMEFKTEETVTDSSTKIIPANSLLFGIRVGIGKSSINAMPLCPNQDIVGIFNMDEKEFDLLFIKKVLETYAVFFEGQKRGATIKVITIDLLKSIDIPSAPITLQNRFADFVRPSLSWKRHARHYYWKSWDEMPKIMPLAFVKTINFRRYTWKIN
jgi:type I restriction enzyme S subunit